jgi:hypothetical protein
MLDGAKAVRAYHCKSEEHKKEDLGFWMENKVKRVDKVFCEWETPEKVQ